MKIWFDTEFFENGHTIDLISIGLVREDGQTYYAETMEAHYFCRKSDWLVQNVEPHLHDGDAKKLRFQIMDEIREFAGENPEFWAYYGAYDWVALCQLYGTMLELPEGWPFWCRDLKQLCASLGDPKLPKQTTPEHHALNDALWTRDAHLWLAANAPLFPENRA